MDRPHWGHRGPDIVWSPLQATGDGCSCNIVFDIACIDTSTSICVGVLFPCLSTIRVKGLPAIEPTTRSLTAIDVVCHKSGLVPLFVLKPESVVMQHPTFDSCDFQSMVELCSGVGVATWGFKECNVNVEIAVEKQETFAEKYLECHPTTTVVCGDITKPDTIREVCALANRPGTLFAGFNCQPYSRAGSQQGALDDRSNSLHAALNLAYLLRTPLVILECVCEAANNRHVNHELSAFCEQCKFVRSEITLRLEQIWPCKRERWWVVLSTSTLGKVPLRPFMPRAFPTTIHQILPFDLPLSVEDLKALQLSPFELRRFMQFQQNLHAMKLNRGGQCPTLLHSLGSQATSCFCGCRTQGFSDAVLDGRGIFGILMEAPGSTEVDGRMVPNVRHPHPIELCILSAIPVMQSLSQPLRLWLAGIGQQANPTQALWVISWVFRHLQTVFNGVATISPQSVLDQYLDKVLLQFRAVVDANRYVGPQSPPKLVVDEEVDEEMPAVGEPVLSSGSFTTVTDPVPPLDELSFVLSSTGQHAHCVVKMSRSDLTVGHLKAAEVGMTPVVNTLVVQDGDTGLELPNETMLSGRHVLVELNPVLPPAPSSLTAEVPVPNTTEVSMDSPPISPTIPFVAEPAGADQAMHRADSAPTCPEESPEVLPSPEPLVALKAPEFLQIRPPTVVTLQHVDSMIRPSISQADRLSILEAQGLSWADDEIRWHLQDLIGKVGSEKVVVLDPLIATSVVHTGNPSLIYQWFRPISSVVNCIVSVIWSNQHWIPQVWTWQGDTVTAHSWDGHGVIQRFNVLHDALSKAIGLRTFLTHISHRNIALDAYCGICAIRFLHHRLLGRMLPTDLSDVTHLQKVAKEMFIDSVTQAPSVPRPWMWANGMDPSSHSRLLELLVQHGVPSDLAEARAHVLTTAVGFQAVQKAVVGSAPWRSLKAIANQVRPAVQLVLPDELAVIVQQKVAKGVVNPKKRKGQGKSVAPAPPVALDPLKLQFDDGTFVTDNGTAVPMIPVQSFGPTATGVALTTLDAVAQFLKVGHVVSSLPLAAFVINCLEADLQTALTWSQTRVPVRCIANQEPMLLTGFLIQFGGSVVVPSSSDKPQHVAFAQAACVKIAVYRDSCLLDWNDFAKSPVKYILQQLVPLQTCDGTVPNCRCDKFHREEASPIQDPVFDVWRRQWLALSFRPTPQANADVFVVCVRYLQKLERVLLSKSGVGGIFLEPRSLDGRDPCTTYQAIWMPKSTTAELMHLCQTMPQLIGIIRMGQRLGVRTCVEDASEVNGLLRPNNIMLHQGPRQDFEIGPIPFGMDRAAVAALCESFQWKAKPVNPLRSIPGSVGMMWHVVAVTDPDNTVFATKVGDIVVTKVASKQQTPSPANPIVASQATLRLCEASGSSKTTDPFVSNDPWNTPMARLFLKNPPAVDPTTSLQQVEARIEKAVLSKLPKQIETMEIDDDAASSKTRLQTLEDQMQQLTTGHRQLEARIDENSRKTDAQFAQVHHQVAAQIESQGQHMEQLFRGQMSQIENLLKKGRLE